MVPAGFNTGIRSESEYPLMEFSLSQGMQYTEIKWVRNNMESINGSIGGLFSFIIGFVAIAFSCYQGHNYENELVSKLYTRKNLELTQTITDEQVALDDDEEKISKKGDQKLDLVTSLAERVPVTTTFMDRFLTKICCRPCKRWINPTRFDRIKIIAQARKQIDDEIDIFSFV